MLQAGFILLAALLISSPSVNAVTLEDLSINGGQIIFEDKIFYGFHNVTQSGSLNVPLDQIFVDPVVGGTSGGEAEHGIRFSSSLWTLAGPGLTYDLSFDFHVLQAQNAPKITDNTLEISGGFVGTGRASISEGVIDHATSATLANKLVYFDSVGENLVDHEVFPGGPYVEIEISKDFAMSTGTDPNARVFVSHFDQTFSQVPEGGPSFAGLAALALITVLGRRRA